jgi:hypothetical protein
MSGDYAGSEVGFEPVRGGFREGATPPGVLQCFAGLTAVVAMLGVLTPGIGILSGMALGAALSTVPAAVTLLPALLSLPERGTPYGPCPKAG